MHLNGKSAKLVQSSRSDIEARADALAQRLGCKGRLSAFKKLDAGKLPSTIATTELKLFRHLLQE